ncbi:cupredoxin domain-containing protein [Streptomyces werraensis]|uniref:cupredoxin domain-containing protein n=1 Tax=Streptomyces werraensis TaxID=68284 RepID=UPI0033AEB60F
MNAADVGVLAGAVALIAFLAWCLFGPKRTSEAELKGGVQEIGIMVKGGYAPDVIRVRQGVPVRLVFDRQEGGDCTSRVVFPDFQLAAPLPAFATTPVEFTPDKAAGSASPAG